jgi:predicted RNA-binding Zn ribbon-like protein
MGVATTQQIRDVYETSLQGNHLALDFINTVDWRLAPQRHELVPDIVTLVHWGRRLALISDTELSATLADLSATQRRALLERVLDVRELLYEIFAATASGDSLPSDQVRKLTGLYSEAVAHASLVSEGIGYTLSWAGSDPVERIRWAVCAAAMELLISDDLVRVKQCRHEGCGWVFLDKSKNSSRRWCSMQGCGARAKMRRRYRRQKEGLES